MDDYLFLVPALVPLLFAGILAYRYFHFGGLLGMTLGARVSRTIGEASTEKSLGVSKKLGVHVLERVPGRPTFVVIGETSSGMGSWSYRIMKLSAEEARKLAGLLSEAADEAAGSRRGRP